MCGFVGFLAGSGSVMQSEASGFLSHMSDAITNRGPDGLGIWVDVAAGIGLAHRRLAILELTEAGAQPMKSSSGRYVIAFNGEIYNHLRLRARLERGNQGASPWNGHSDTETLLACIEAWGIRETLEQAIGMFAIALWDKVDRTLTLIRDRMGEKPLYYGWQGQGNQKVFLFGSDLAALRRHPAFSAEINRDSLALFMRHNCIGGEHSIYTDIRKLEPGNLLTISVAAPEPRVKVWWSASDVAKRGVAQPFERSSEQAVDALDELLRDAVGQQMLSDVPLGAFLSGGIDSSTVVALMQAQSNRPVKTFSIGFHEAGYNEAEHAKAVAEHLGTDHTELYVTAEQAMAVIPRLPDLYSEPFADSSQIPTFLVSQLARKHVTVSLSGDAGDELFCGYSRYPMTEGVWSKFKHIPMPARALMARGIKGLPPGVWDQLGRFTGLPRVGDRLHKGAELLCSTSVEALYRGMVSQWQDPAALVIGAHEPQSVLGSGRLSFQRLNEVERMMALDILSYLPDDILVKVDRAAMGVSLETRVPLLDHRVVEFAWRLRFRDKLRKEGGKYITKWALRQVLYRYVPRSLIERPKMGFGIPIDKWLRGPLRDWAEALLDDSRLQREGFFYPQEIRRKWQEHLSGRRNWQHQLWCVLMFQAWLEKQEND
jgi:asparagine synthase (glutamine-hydrolysing)